MPVVLHNLERMKRQANPPTHERPERPEFVRMPREVKGNKSGVHKHEDKQVSAKSLPTFLGCSVRIIGVILHLRNSPWLERGSGRDDTALSYE